MIFIILKKLFEPIIIFFKLANSLAISQIIINKILQDLINTGEVVSFIDNIIVGMKEEECYELKSLEWDNKTTLVLSNTRELDRELFYKLVYLI